MLPSKGISDLSLPHGVFHYMVDVAPRATPVISIGDETGAGQWREVQLLLSHPDLLGGKYDVAGVLVWGDVDPAFHPYIAATAGVSVPISPPFTRLPLVLSAGPGVKTINTRLIFSSGRTIDAVKTYTLTDGLPHVTVMQQPFRQYLQSTDTVKIGWSCSHALTLLEVCMAPSSDAARADCTVLGSGTNVNSAGAIAAGALVQSSFTYAAALAAQAALSSTGSTYVKVFATTAKGITT